jgi:hypothetical protein
MPCAAIAMSLFVAGWQPPPAYDHEPTEPYEVVEVPCQVMHAVCNGPYIGCTKPAMRVIVVDGRLNGTYREKVVRHEKAHLNGWRH